MGLRDAANLAFKFDLIFKEKADDRLLDSYAQERWENCKSIILAATAVAARMMDLQFSHLSCA